MFSRYYQSELSYLRELGREFASVNPGLAGLFAERGGDPDVERLLEGFAFLTARIRERIDDAIPEVIDTVAKLVVPQLIQPIPSCSIVEFQPNFSALRGIHVVEAHTELSTSPIQGTSGRYRTTAPIELLPLEITKISMDHTRESTPCIHVHFQRRGRSHPWPDDGKIKFFLHGPLSQTSTLFLWLNRYLSSVKFQCGEIERKLPEAKVEPLGLSPEFPLLPWPEYAPEGLRLIQEYFTLPSKLNFFELQGLERIPDEIIGDSFQIICEFNRPPGLPERLDEDIFRLHCVPVVNLFNTTAEPIVYDPEVFEYFVRAAGVDPQHMEIYSVDSVIGLSRRRQNRQNYSSFYSFSHLETKNDENRAFYYSRRSLSPIDGATDVYLSVMTPFDTEPNLDEEVLSIELTCTNRSLPTEFRVGDICVPTPQSPTLAKFANITEVTRPARAPFGTEMHWRVVAHLALNVHTLTDPLSLRSLLNLYNLHGDADHNRSRSNILHIQAIRSVKTKIEQRVMDRVPVRGFHTQIEVEEGGFASLGDIFVFGSALDWLFATETPINSYNRLSLRVHPSGVEFQWTPKTGTQPIF